MTHEIHLTLKSDATFGRGEGLAGLVDAEVEYDTAGFPFLRGRTLKGLLVEECANILYAVSRQATPSLPDLRRSAAFLFGTPGSTVECQAHLHIGPATLPEDLRIAASAAGLSSTDVLNALTGIRRQTSVDESTGAPEDGSLRSTRVIFHGTTFVSPISFDRPPEAVHLALLAACCSSLRRAGTSRNRGRARLRTALYAGGADATDLHLDVFEKNIGATR